MKKLLISFLLILSYFFSVGQVDSFPIVQGLGSGKTLVNSPGAIRSHLINYTFTDTSQANLLSFFKWYDGGQIMTTTGGLKTWGRYNNTWVLQSGGGSGGSGWLLGGNDLTNSALEYFGSHNNMDVNVGSNNLKRFSLNKAGILPLAGTSKAIGIDSVTGYLTYASGGSGVSYFQNPLTGDTLLTNPSTDHFLIKSLVAGYGIINTPTDTTIVQKVDTATLFPAIRATINTGGSQTPWLSNINGANYGLDSVKWLRVGISGGVITENLAFYSAEPQNASYYGSTDITVTGNQALDVEGNLTMAELNITNAGSNLFRNVNTPDLLVTPGETLYFSMDVKQGTLTGGTYSVFDATNSVNIIAPTNFSIPAGLSTRFTSASFVVPMGCTEIYIYPARDVPSTGTYFVGRFQVAHVGNAYIQTTNAQAPPSGGGGYATAISTDSVTANVGIGIDPSSVFKLQVSGTTLMAIQWKDHDPINDSSVLTLKSSSFKPQIKLLLDDGDGDADTAYIGASRLGFGQSIMFGINALKSNHIKEDSTSIDWNTALGNYVLEFDSLGSQNTGVGYQALQHTNGSNNTGVGVNALIANTIGNDNTTLGISAGQTVTTGNANVALGAYSLQLNTSGDSILAVGFYAGSNETRSNKIYIGTARDNSDLGTDTTTTPIYINNSSREGFWNQSLFVQDSLKIGKTRTVSNAVSAYVKDPITNKVALQTISTVATAVPLSGITTSLADNQVNQNGKFFNIYGDVGLKRTWFFLGKDSTMIFALYNTSGVELNGMSLSGVDTSVAIAGKKILLSGGKVGISAATPTALLQIGAGTATANTAPLKFTSGTVMTTPEAGALEYNSGLLMLDSSNSQRDTIATRKWARNNISSGGGSSLAIGSTITSATAGSVLFAGTGGTLMQKNSDLFYDSTNIRFGIGTSSPTKRLTVYNGEIAIATPASGMSTFNFGTLTTPNYYTIQYNDNTGNTTLGSNGYDQIFMNTNISAELMRIKSNGNVGIGNNSPASTLDVVGSLSLSYIAKTTTYTATGSDYTIDCTGGGTFNVTLPTAVGCQGRIYIVKNSGAGVITVATTSSQNIDVATTYTLAAIYKYVTVMSTGANYIVIANN